MVRPQSTNNNSPDADQAEAVDPTFFEAEPLQPGEVCLHLWMLYTPQSPILDLTGSHIKTKEDIEAAFHALNLCTHANRSLITKKDANPNSQSKYLSDSDSDDNEINPRLKTSIEERQYTIPGSAIATCIALSYSRVQANPTVERGPPQQKVITKKPSAEETKIETSSTPHKDK